MYFYQQLLNYPIELKVMPYVEKAYEQVLSNPSYYLPNEDELEDIYNSNELLSSIKNKRGSLVGNIDSVFYNNNSLNSLYKELNRLNDKLELINFYKNF